MVSGGARSRSGPPPDPNSGRSEKRGYKLAALPAEGYDGPAPEFPLPEPSERELQLWEWAWSTPQACAWSMPSERWRVYMIGMWVRVAWRCEAADAGPSMLGALHRFADQIGFTTRGLAEMGWRVAVDEVAARAASAGPATPRERRLREADPDPDPDDRRQRFSPPADHEGA